MPYHIIYGACGCRIWPLAAGQPFSKCNLCHDKLHILSGFSDEDYERYKRIRDE